MSFFRSRLSQIARIALLAMLMAAFAPTLSRTLSDGGDMAWMELCTVSGIEYVLLDGDDGSSPPASDMAHCPYCKINGGAPVLASAADAVVLIAPVTVVAVPEAFLHAPRPLHVWSAASPRAPPVHA